MKGLLQVVAYLEAFELGGKGAVSVLVGFEPLLTDCYDIIAVPNILLYVIS